MKHTVCSYHMNLFYSPVRQEKTANNINENVDRIVTRVNQSRKKTDIIAIIQYMIIQKVQMNRNEKYNKMQYY